jgi:hypothetical protein
LDRRRNQEAKETIGKQDKVDVVLGLDISTACTALSVLDKQSGTLLFMAPIILNNKKSPDFWSKIDLLKNEFENIFNKNSNWNITKISVEENAKRFSPGFSSADTIITLAKFNGIICYVLYCLTGIPPTYINVRTARSVLNIKIDYKNKKEKTKQKVLNIVYSRHPEFPWILKTNKNGTRLVKINEDAADSYVIAEAGRLLG